MQHCHHALSKTTHISLHGMLNQHLHSFSIFCWFWRYPIFLRLSKSSGLWMSSISCHKHLSLSSLLPFQDFIFLFLLVIKAAYFCLHSPFLSSCHCGFVLDKDKAMGCIFNFLVACFLSRDRFSLGSACELRSTVGL